jgi:hypothetical protein
MDQIVNYNCHNKQLSCLCCEMYCNEVETHFQILEIRGFKFIVSFCEKHMEEFEKKLMESRNLEKGVAICPQN